MNRPKPAKANKALNHVDLDDEAASDDSRSSESSDSDKESFIDPRMDGSSIEHLLKKPGPVGTQTASSPFTGDQMRAIQQTEAFQGGQSHPSTGVLSAQPRPAGTATPLGLHRPLDRVLEDKILQGGYVDFTLLLPDSIAHPPRHPRSNSGWLHPIRFCQPFVEGTLLT